VYATETRATAKENWTCSTHLSGEAQLCVHIERPQSQMSAEETPSTSTDGTADASTSQPVNPMLQTALTKRFQGRYQPLQMPTPEQIMGEDLMNNCAVKCLLSGVGGGVLGVAFGIFTASLDTSVRTQQQQPVPLQPCVMKHTRGDGAVVCCLPCSIWMTSEQEASRSPLGLCCGSRSSS
jgi:hypothetical protein